MEPTMTDTRTPTPTRRRRLRPAALLHGSALLVITAVLATIETKLPPFKAD
jgi:hypothetical protein